MGKFSSFRDKLKSAVSRIRAGSRKEVEEEKQEAPPLHLSAEAMSFIRSFTEENPGRAAASEGSKNAARRLFAVFREYSGDNAVITTLRITPYAYKAMLRVAVAVSAAMSFFNILGIPWISLAVSLFYISQLGNELRKKQNRFRKFFVTSEAYNVHAVVEPEGECRNTVIFTAHHDSAEIRKKEKGVKGILSSIIPMAVSYSALTIVSLILLLIEMTKGKFFGFPHYSIVIISIILLFPLLSAVFYLRSCSGKYSVGAGDNASGVAIITALLHYYSRQKAEGRGLLSTRLVFASFDGEECGTEGSLGWFRDNTHLMSNKTYVLNFDGIYNEKDLVFLAKDGNGLIPLSFSLASRCSRIASSMGYHIGVGKLGLFGGETDAASASVMGLPAVTLTSMAPGTETPAHTDDDTPDKISEEAVSEAISVAIKLVAETDEEEQKAPHASYLDNSRHYKISKY